MTFNDLINSLFTLWKSCSGDAEVVIGTKFGNDGKLESVSLQVETLNGENVVIMEEPVQGRLYLALDASVD